MKIRIGLLSLLVLLAVSAKATDVMFFVDAEDYTSDFSSDAIRDLAKLFDEEQVCAQFNVVGYLARQLRQQGRDDVFRALKPHLIGSHTLYYAKRPTVAEATDVADAAQAGRLAMAEESLSLGLIKSSFGLRDVSFHSPSGPYSYAALYAASDLGMKFCVGSGLNGLSTGGSFWYCGLLHLPVLADGQFSLESLMPPAPEPDFAAVLDRLASEQYVGLCVESSFVACRERWTKLNFNPRKPVAFGEWKKNTRRPAADVSMFYERLRKLIRAIRADQRFRLVTVMDYAETLPLRRPITLRDVPTIRHELQQKFGPLTDPSLSLSDVYQACVDLLNGEKSFLPGRVRGFLEEPEGVKVETVVDAAELREATSHLTDVDYIPARITVGKTILGPADFVMAALEILETGAKSVKVSPRDQLALPNGKWPIKSGKDKFLSDRLRLQSWTLRYESR